MQWYYAENGKQMGPHSDQEFAALVNSGKITADTLVWKAGMAAWAAYGTVAGAAQSPAPATAAAGSIANVLAQRTAAASDDAGTASAGGVGNTPNRDLMAYARESLSGKWGRSVGFLLLYWLISFAAGCVPVAGSLISFLVAGPLSVGLVLFFMTMARGESAPMSTLFSGFSSFGTALAAYLLMTVFIILWSLLLLVPGIIAAYSYTMTFYIIADDPSIGPLEAIRTSKAMMQGNKWKFFCLNMRFVGWAFLCLFTFGVGFLFLAAYMTTSVAHFYDDVRGNNTGAAA